MQQVLNWPPVVAMLASFSLVTGVPHVAALLKAATLALA
jgi:hypothetical protein